MLLLLSFIACRSSAPAEAAPLTAAAEAATLNPAPPSPVPAPPPATPATAVLELRVSPASREVYVKPVRGSRLRGMLAAHEPFEVLERVAGTGCGGDGWGKLQAGGFACLDGTATTSDPAVELPRLVAFDPPLPDEYYSYVETGHYNDDPPDQVDPILPYIYGKSWRTWRGHLWNSPEDFAAGKPSVGQLETGFVHKSHFIREVETPKGEVLVREDGKVSPLDDVWIYPVSRHQGRDLVKDPLPPGMWPAWTVDYEGAEVHATPDPASPIEVLIPHHTPLVIESTPADPTGHWWKVPDLLGPGKPGYLEDIEGIRHPTVRPRPLEVGADEQWVDIDIAQEIFMLYQGDQLQFVTMVATGDLGWGTPKGLFRIHKKMITADMSSKADNPKPYFVEDVPWTMYFYPRYALHGVFWHWGLGRIASHGCVNLAPRDAKAMFERLGPAVPKGWSTIWSTDDDPGTTLRVRVGDVEGPDRRNISL